jgi:hypothetical protein
VRNVSDLSPTAVLGRHAKTSPGQVIGGEFGVAFRKNKQGGLEIGALEAFFVSAELLQTRERPVLFCLNDEMSAVGYDFNVRISAVLRVALEAD